MSDRHELPDRPAPPQSLARRAAAWLQWVGPGRVVSGAVVVLAVLAGAYWLVRPPAPSPESTLPFAGAASSTSVSTTSDGAPSTTAPPDTVVVHVAGAVVAAGVFELPAGSRVVDAVQAAGGTVADAQPDAVNLAALLVDGERIYVPRVGEEVPAPSPPSGASTPTGPLDLNTATAEQLDDLPGVGPATAAAIVAHRDTHGPFSSVEELADVRGIGPAKLAAIRELVTV